MRHNWRKHQVRNFDGFVENACVVFALAMFVLQFANAFAQLRRGFVGANLKLVILVFARVFFVASFGENQFAQFAKSCGRRKLAAAPQCLMTLANRGDQRFFGNRRDIECALTSELVFGNLAVRNRQVGNNVFVAFAATVCIGAIEKAPRNRTGDNSRVSRAKLVRVSIAKRLFNGLCKFGGCDFLFLALDHDKRVFARVILENDDVGGVFGRSVGTVTSSPMRWAG